MKYFQTITKFRVAYQKLGYVKNKKLTVTQLIAWVETWCEEENITDGDLIYYFKQLAQAYADKDLAETFLYRRLKK
ncbi:MAG: hypothetical protein IJ317_04160 [Clostridia bacterium]|nr:hypothetical protein [Clostridia bacterium]